MTRDGGVADIEYLEDLTQTTPRAISQRRSRQESHLVIIQKSVDGPFIEWIADVEKSDRKIRNEVFEDHNKLGNIIAVDVGQIRETAQVSTLKFPQFIIQMFAETHEKIPEPRNNSVLCLEKFVDLTEDVKKVTRKFLNEQRRSGCETWRGDLWFGQEGISLLKCVSTIWPCFRRRP